MPSEDPREDELPKQYDPTDLERRAMDRWLEAGAFRAFPDRERRPYVIMMPLPNVTGALHMGHAMDNVMQDLLIRWHRMRGDNVLWQPGTDHAGIATQAVVEKRLFELEGKTRHDLGREGLVARIWEWKEVNQKRIIGQQQAMGCSCDWERYRFTMDAVCTRAVRRAFFDLFQDGLIYRGQRMVNWDCRLQTAVSDDEIVYEKVKGHFWHLRYPVLDPAPGEPEHVTVATTRPETMLGDTAVAVHPDPRGALAALVAGLEARLADAPPRERPALEEELAGLRGRIESHAPRLELLARMAREGRRLLLPLMRRPIPLILDEWARPELGSGCVKITPAHDPNDYQVWQRHLGEIECIHILNVDGTLNEHVGPYQGLGRFEARERVLQELEAQGLLERVEEREVEIGHSDRSKTPIEPFISRQWFLRMGDVPGGVVCGKGTAKRFTAPGLAQAAMDAVGGGWKSASGRGVAFHPDGERYASTYLNWLAEKRDWCISRQLWWGHRIPVWSGSFAGPGLGPLLADLRTRIDPRRLVVRLEMAGGTGAFLEPGTDLEALAELQDGVDVLACLAGGEGDQELADHLAGLGLLQDPDALDTWFSSALWPQSTLGWPDPQSAEVDPGQPALGPRQGRPSALEYYYPGSCLVTGREIITLWVARMVAIGLYNLGDVPFTDVFIHANILDGKGERMSKSRGNGIDPVDIAEMYGTDAMRYVLCELQTGSQDVRLPVQALSPFTGELVDLAEAKHGRSIFTYLCPQTGKEFDVLGTMPGVPSARIVSNRFEVGRAFCNKLWNAARFVLLNLEQAGFAALDPAALPPEDRWILSRLSRACAEVARHLEAYGPSGAIGAARDFFWSELCDWYLELIKPRLKDPGRAGAARQVLAFVLDHVLRLLHPFVPFITEALWERLNAQAPTRGLSEPLRLPDLILHAPWPVPDPGAEDAALEARFGLLQETIRTIRDLRAKYGLPPSQPLRVRVRAEGQSAAALEECRGLLVHLAGLESLSIEAQAERAPDAATAVVRDTELALLGVVDVARERDRLARQREKLLERILACRRKLANEAFVAKAKPEVVEREKSLLADLQAQLESLEASLKSLEG